MRLVYTVQNLLPGDCRLGVQPVHKVSELNSMGLFARGIASLYSFLTYLQGTVPWGAVFYTVSEPSFRELSTGGAAFYMVSEPSSRELSAGVAPCLWFPNLSAGHCLSEVQPVFTVSEPSRRLLARG